MEQQQSLPRLRMPDIRESLAKNPIKNLHGFVELLVHLASLVLSRDGAYALSAYMEALLSIADLNDAEIALVANTLDLF